MQQCTWLHLKAQIALKSRWLNQLTQFTEEEVAFYGATGPPEAPSFELDVTYYLEVVGGN